MPHHRNNIDALIAELQTDLPSANDQERVRKQLVSAGLFVGAAGASLGAQAAGLEASGSGLATGAPEATTLVGKLWSLTATTKAVLVTVALGGGALVTPNFFPGPETPPEAPRTSEALTSDAPAMARTSEPQNQPTFEHPGALIDQNPVERPLHREPSLSPPKLAQRPLEAKKVEAPRSAPPMSPSSELAEETRLMESALLAVQRGDHQAASRFLTLHNQKYPRGALSPERERLRARLTTPHD